MNGNGNGSLSNRLLLGIPNLWDQWKAMFTFTDLGADLIAGTTVAFVAIPLSLAIALASGVDPAVGLSTAIIAGIVCALFGGTPLAVSGPAAAMSVLVATNVEMFGAGNVMLICLVAGIFQILSGVFGLGKLARFVPLPVISGFTAGIGFIILISQLPRAFGLPPPAESHVFDVLRHIKDYFHEIKATSLLVVIITVIIIRGLPKIFPRVPAILPAVITATLIVYFFNLNDVPLIGAIPNNLPAPKIPTANDITLTELIFNAFTVYLLASLETLLSSTAVDKLSQGKKHNSNQELIGQGLGNVSVSFFGGIPVTGVIARSATNVRAGAKTRRSSIIHSFIILLAVYIASPLIGLIPIAALAGVLFSIAFSMLNYQEFHDFWVTSRSEALIYGITFFTIVFVDLIAGVQAGIIAASLIILFKAAQSRAHVTPSSRDDIIRFSMSGALTFLSCNKISDLENQLDSSHTNKIVLLDLSAVTDLDTSGATAIVDLYKHCKENKIKFYIKGLQRRFEPLFNMLNANDLIHHHYLVSEHELRKKEHLAPKSAIGRLMHGVQRFYQEQEDNDKRLFDYIAKHQDPHTLFITCADSRIVPSTITSSDPGELFIIRNVGNVIPVYPASLPCSEVAALEFSLNNFDITDVVICGHASCGAMSACLSKDDTSIPNGLKAWIQLIKSQLTIHSDSTVNDVAKQNIINQIKNLKSYPFVQEKIKTGKINIHGWFFDFDSQTVSELNIETQDFKAIEGTEKLH